MKKTLLTVFAGLITIIGSAQTATNFNCNDCNLVNHDLFTELNSGKVIVLCWVMPCGACVAPAQSAHNIVQSYSVSNPGQVLFYLCDDFGTTSCASLNGWKNTNSLTNATVFSNSLISMSNYGSNGMPKIVVLGGASHTIFDNQNNTLNASTFSTAINNALAASATGITEISSNNFQSGISPNPANNELTLAFNNQSTENISIEIYNSIGQKVKTSEQPAIIGKNELKINTEALSNGNYFIKLNNGKKSDTIKFLIAH